MLGFFILLIVMMGLWFYMIGFADVEKIRKNWKQYRCVPFLLPFSSFFGYDTTENFTFCLQGILNGTIGPILGPIFSILATFVKIFSVLIDVVNNVRLMIATFLGGINVVFQNFMDRFIQLSDNFKRTMQRVRMLLSRLYATFFSIIFLAMSAQTALMNFGDTVLFRFLDTFCFDPDTQIEIVGKGKIAIREVRNGDVLSTTGGKVISTFQFQADGQPMVQLPGSILVSTNHYLQYKNTFVRADQHPDAVLVEPWKGGKARPLICLNTSDHKIPIGNFIFLDYDETSEADQETMEWVSGRVNARQSLIPTLPYTTVFSPEILVRMKSGVAIPAKSIGLGMELQQGKVVGIVQKEVSEVCSTESGELISPGMLIWRKEEEVWKRAAEVYPIHRLRSPAQFVNFFVESSAVVQTVSDLFLRDYMEVYSPETEQFYAKAITAASCH